MLDRLSHSPALRAAVDVAVTKKVDADAEKRARDQTADEAAGLVARCVRNNPDAGFASPRAVKRFARSAKTPQEKCSILKGKKNTFR